MNRFTERTQRVIMIAEEEANRLGQDHIGTEHLVFALLSLGDGAAEQTVSSSRLTMFIANLMKYGVSVTAIEQAADNCGLSMNDKPLIRFAESIAGSVLDHN